MSLVWYPPGAFRVPLTLPHPVLTPIHILLQHYASLPSFLPTTSHPPILLFRSLVPALVLGIAPGFSHHHTTLSTLAATKAMALCAREHTCCLSSPLTVSPVFAPSSDLS
ncbi:hypothetical protein FS749_007124 [Ceratobasidium sp. UAMH 11750]|nr:hypothetical protein FS749_007124 [Ceratobasidium sp. UAMH 11750]